ncbi:MAG: hypothetical protein ABR968_03030 [Bacteroidales bacterium]|jgi:hypothetical protein
MKKFIIPCMILLLSSCAETNFYQVYKTNFNDGALTKEKIVFEDNNCSVSYNLWLEGGNMGFVMYNKTENYLTVNLAKTFFVLNGIAYEFFQNRTFYPSSNATVANLPGNSRNNLNNELTKGTATSSLDFSTAFIEKPVLTIPPKTSINISGYIIATSRYVDCGLLKYPTKKSMKTIAFDNTSSPFTFYNIITYAVKGDTSKLENRFYVSEITNYPSSEMFKTVDTSICGGKLDAPIDVFKNMTPDKFYIKYSK